MLKKLMVAAVLALSATCAVTAADPPACRSCNCEPTCKCTNGVCPVTKIKTCACVPHVAGTPWDKDKNCGEFTCPANGGKKKVTAANLNIVGQNKSVPFDAIQFSHEGGKTKFVWLRLLDSAGDTVDLYSDLVYGQEDPELELNGKPATAAEVEAWASKTVDCRVRITLDGLSFSGGKPAYQTIASPALRWTQPQQSCPTCPNGRCPLPTIVK